MLPPRIEPYPLTFRPILMPKVWGGRRLAGLGKQLPTSPDTSIGESWELADLPSTSASGGGGGAARSIIDHGPLAGRTLADASAAWGSALIGRAGATPSSGFPLLVKYLDAREHLSVQVHPSIAYCKADPSAHLKTECWYILDAEPGSTIFKGVKPGVTRGEFERALRGADPSSVVELLDSVPATPGDCHLLPSGTVHALGAGVLVAEVQTPSDTTFRVYDWAKEYGREGRELHVAQSLECIAWEPAREATRFGRGVGQLGDAPAAVNRQTTLVTTGFFDVDEWRGEPGTTHALGGGERLSERPQVLMMLRGEGILRSTSDRFAMTRIGAGQTVLVASSIAGSAEFRFEGKGEGVLLRTVVR